MEIAVSAGVRAPMSSPIGAHIPARSASDMQFFDAIGVRSPTTHRSNVAGRGSQGNLCSSGMSNFTSWVRMMSAVRSSTGAASQAHRDRVGIADPIADEAGAPARDDVLGLVIHRRFDATPADRPGDVATLVDGEHGIRVPRRRCR